MSIGRWKMCVAMLALGIAAPVAQAAGPWTLSGSLGYVDGYRERTERYGEQTYPQTFGATGAWRIGIDHRLAGPWSLGASSGRLRYRRPVYFAVPASDEIDPAPPPGRIDATFVPVALGLRWQPGAAVSRARPWLYVAPAVVFARWSETGTPNDQAFDRALAGWTAGGGLAFAASDHVRLEAGVSWLGTTDPDREVALPGGGTRTYHGLGQAVYGVGIALTP